MSKQKSKTAYKINVKGMWFAEVNEDTDEALTHKAVEKIAETMEVQMSPKISEGSLFGDGAKVFTTSRKNSFEIAVDITDIPPKYRTYMQGTEIKAGVEIGKVSDEPKPFACGFLIEKTNGVEQKIWFPYCIAKPIEENVKQSEENITFSTDKLVITALQHKAIKRLYTRINGDMTEVTTEMQENFFKKVQVEDTITGL